MAKADKDAKAFELIYSQQKSGFVEGRAYANPRFFTSPREGVTKVLIVGNWPNIELAYAAKGVPVEVIDGQSVLAGPAPATLAPPKPAAEDPASVVIPGNWKELGWSKPNAEGLTLRGLASSLSAVPVLNKEAAYAAIEGELKRRWLDEEHAEAGGLTRRELHADLTAMNADWGDIEDPVGLLRMRDQARSAH